uniref:Zpr1 domain-containing protein n=1 Tax=Panagrellus redivivus TaxID=6233 RepID=A0A7E4ZYM7_PANRE
MLSTYSISQSKTKHIKTAQYSLLDRSVRITREQLANTNLTSPPPSPGADKSVFVEVVDKAINETMALAKTPVLRIGATVAVPNSTCEELTVPFAPSKQNVIDSLIKEFEHQSESDITGSSDEESEHGSTGAWSIASTGLEKLEITVKLFMEPL